jgi:DNA-binding transcriptional ArsR family regulator
MRVADVSGLLRSPLLAEILHLVLVERGEWTAEQLATRTEVPYPTVTKELRRLEVAGVVRVETIGRTKFFTAAVDDPATRALARLVALGVDAKGGGDMSKKKDKKKDSKKKKK